MRKTKYTDALGRVHATLLPDDAPDSEASMGLLLGPPTLTSLNLPIDIEVRLHNELAARELYSIGDVRKRRQDVLSALLATLKLDVQSIIDVYQEAAMPSIEEEGALAGGDLRNA